MCPECTSIRHSDIRHFRNMVDYSKYILCRQSYYRYYIDTSCLDNHRHSDTFHSRNCPKAIFLLKSDSSRKFFLNSWFESDEKFPGNLLQCIRPNWYNFLKKKAYQLGQTYQLGNPNDPKSRKIEKTVKEIN